MKPGAMCCGAFWYFPLLRCGDARGVESRFREIGNVKKTAAGTLLGVARGRWVMRGSGEVEAIQLCDLGPGGDEVVDEFSLGVFAAVDFRHGAELGV